MIASTQKSELKLRPLEKQSSTRWKAIFFRRSILYVTVRACWVDRGRFGVDFSAQSLTCSRRTVTLSWKCLFRKRLSLNAGADRDSWQTLLSRSQFTKPSPWNSFPWSWC
jgi:hypothetical protein